LVIGGKMGQWPTNNGYFTANGLDTLYVDIQPYKITQQSTSTASAAGISKSKEGECITLLMPSTYSTTITHEWDNVDQLGTRFVQKYHKIEMLSKDLINTGSSVMGGSGTGGVITAKLDTPITFKDSNRRTLDLTFELADQGDTKKDVFDPVRKLEKYSCASKSSSTMFELPYIFKVNTINSELIRLENAALISVQPTYYGPYRMGYPSKCELILSFRDMEPLYRSSF